MEHPLKNRSFLKEVDFSAEEWTYLLDLSARLKHDKQNGKEHQYLHGKNIALLFEKTSTRTRCSFEVAARDQGAYTTYLNSQDSHIGKKESIKDTARVLGRMFDGVAYRGFAQSWVEELAEYTGVPVWNSLTTEWHPTQALADQLTLREKFGTLKGLKIAFLGDARNNVSNSLMMSSAMMGMDFRAVAPKSLWPSDDVLTLSCNIAKNTQASIKCTESLSEGVKGVDAVYTDVWVSMGEDPSVWGMRIQNLKPYQVNASTMALAADTAVFMHCLPAFHNLETQLAKDIFAKYHVPEMEVSEKVFESAQSVVFDQAENRLHTIKAMMVATLG